MPAQLGDRFSGGVVGRRGRSLMTRGGGLKLEAFIALRSAQSPLVAGFAEQ